MSFEINKVFNTCFNSDKINLDLELSSGVMFDRTVDTPPFTFYMQCEMTLYDCKSTFKIIDLT